jgi:hypothetical protein
MDLEITLSQWTAEWLAQKAREAGTDEAVVAARVLDELADREHSRNGSEASDRLRAFDRWIAALPARPGPEVDASRNGIYD